MFLGDCSCPRCRWTKWHRDHERTSNTGVEETIMVCVRCGEKLLVRSTREQPQVGMVCRRWTLFDMGHLKPRYREWVSTQPIGTLYWKGETQ